MAAGFEVAQAYVTLRAETGSLDKDVDGAVKKSGSALGAVGKGVAGLAVGALASVAAIGAGIAGLALKGGFDRALNIQDAQAKLAGLGYGAEQITGIMDNALASVKGTAFGLGDAATVAAGLLAAGVKSGDALTRSLSLTADAATIAGMSLNEMGAINNKIAAQNKLTGETLAQLSDAGLPVLQWIAEAYGVTAEEASKMVSQGEIDFATYERLIEENIGGAALKSGDTFRGALANVMASLGRLGAMFATPIVAGMPQVFQAVTTAVDSLATAIKPVAEAFGAWLAPQLERVAAAIAGIDFAAMVNGAGPVADFFSSMGTYLAPVGAFLGQIGEAFAVLGPVLMETWTNLSPLGLAFQALSPILPVIGDLLIQIATVLSGALAAILPTIATLVTSLATALGGALGAILPAIANLLMTLLDALTPLFPIFAQLATIIADVLVQAITLLTPILTTLINALGPLLTPIIAALVPIIQLIVTTFGELMTAIMPLVSTIIEALLPVILSLIEALLPLVTTIISALLPAFTAIISAIMPIIDIIIAILVPVIEVLGAIITWLVETIVVPLFEAFGAIITWLSETIITPIFDAIGAVFTWLVDTIIVPWFNRIKATFDFLGAVFNALYVTFIKPTFDKIGEVFNWLWNNAIKPVIDFITPGIQAVGDLIKSVFEGAGGAIEGAFKGAVGFIRSAINGIIGILNGGIGAINNLIGAVNQVPGVSIGTLPKIPMLAKGGTIRGSGLALVGEEGPEIVSLQRGATVHPNGTGPGLTSGGGTTVVVENVIIDASNVEDFSRIVEIFKNLPQTARQGRMATGGAY